MTKTPKDRLAEGLKQAGDCLEWQRGKSGRGYGQIEVDGHKVGTHRLAWVLANGCAIPDGMYVLHSCDNPPCCNPEHLHLGTQFDNMREMGERGRSNNQHAPSPGMARLIATYNRNKARRLARLSA